MSNNFAKLRIFHNFAHKSKQKDNGRGHSIHEASPDRGKQSIQTRRDSHRCRCGMSGQNHCPKSQPDRTPARRHCSCRDASHYGSSRASWRKVPYRLHSLRHRRALRDVRRSTRLVTNQQNRLWYARRETWLRTLCAQRTAPSHASHLRRHGRRMCRTDATLLQRKEVTNSSIGKFSSCFCHKSTVFCRYRQEKTQKRACFD